LSNSQLYSGNGVWYITLFVSPCLIALFGQAGSQTSQLTHNSLIFSDIAFAAWLVRRCRTGRHRPVVPYLEVSTKTYSTPAGVTAAWTRSESAALPMNSTRTPFIESAGTPSNAATTRSAILSDAGEA